MTPRKAIQDDVGSQRLPYAAAEALLWGPEMRKQHAWLLEEMRALQAQHEIHIARIQTTEAVVEAAEAATSRIRHLEQQLAAIEAVDNDKAFEKWVSAEIDQLKIFRNDNKHVRQKQIDLDKNIVDFGDNIGQVKHIPDALRGLVRRVDTLEARRREDSERLQILEREIASLKTLRPTVTADEGRLRPDVQGQPSSIRAETPLNQLNHRDAEDSTDAEDEHDNFESPSKITPTPINSTVDVPRTPETRQMSPEVSSLSSPKKSMLSARHRLFKRPSIHNSKIPQILEEMKIDFTIEPQEGQSCRAASPPTTQIARKGLKKPIIPNIPNLPATQIIAKANGKRKHPLDALYTTRVTRSQVQSNENSAKLLGALAPDIKTRGRPKLVAESRLGKLENSTATPIPFPASRKTVATKATQPTLTNPHKRLKLSAAAGLSKDSNVSSTIERASLSPTKRKEHINVLPTLSPDRKVKDGDHSHLQPSAASTFKASRRSIAPKNRPCTSCSKRHRACDRVQPVCGECVKRSQPHACVYGQSLGNDTQSVASEVASHRKKNIQKFSSAPTPAGPSGSGRRADVTESDRPPSSRALSPRKPAIPTHADSTVPISATGPPATYRPRRRKVSDIDYETFMKMKEQDPKF